LRDQLDGGIQGQRPDFVGRAGSEPRELGSRSFDRHSTVEMNVDQRQGLPRIDWFWQPRLTDRRAVLNMNLPSAAG
jgi:hypothetical protein